MPSSKGMLFSHRAGLTSAEVVDRVPGGCNQLEKLVDPCLTGVSPFGGYTRGQSEPYEAEENSLENLFVFLVQWTIQKYVSIECGVVDQVDVYPWGGNGSLP